MGACCKIKGWILCLEFNKYLLHCGGKVPTVIQLAEMLGTLRVSRKSTGRFAYITMPFLMIYIDTCVGFQRFEGAYRIVLDGWKKGVILSSPTLNHVSRLMQLPL